jgi:hypothetical protein
MKPLFICIGFLLTASLLYGQQTATILSKSPIVIQLSPAPQMSNNQVRGGSLTPTSSAIAITPQSSNSFLKETLKFAPTIPSGEDLTNLFVTHNIVKPKVSTIHTPDK